MNGRRGTLVRPWDVVRSFKPYTIRPVATSGRVDRISEETDAQWVKSRLRRSNAWYQYVVYNMRLQLRSYHVDATFLMHSSTV